MGLAKHPSTGSFIGLSRVICRLPVLEKVRESSSGNQNKWFAIATSLGLAYKTFKTYKFHIKFPECPSRVISKLVTHGAEELGNFLIEDQTKIGSTLLSEVRLLLTCGAYTMLGNSVRYEFGYRWYNQTNYDDKFKSNLLDIMEVSPVLSAGATFHQQCLMSDPEDFVADDLAEVQEHHNMDYRIRETDLDSNVEMDCDTILMYEAEDKMFSQEEYSGLVDDVLGNPSTKARDDIEMSGLRSRAEELIEMSTLPDKVVHTRMDEENSLHEKRILQILDFVSGYSNESRVQVSSLFPIGRFLNYTDSGQMFAVARECGWIPRIQPPDDAGGGEVQKEHASNRKYP